jgi:diguanylate cyclase (GGDEF)-like protein
MGGTRKGVTVLAVAVAAALIAGLAWNLVHTEGQGRRSLRDGLEHRATLTARLMASAFMAGNSPQDAGSRYGGSPRAVAAKIAATRALRGGQRLLVLDAGGTVLAATPTALRHDRGLLARSWHLRAALAGKPAISDAFRDARGQSVIELAVPFQTKSGRRVVAGSGPISILQSFIEGFFGSASAVRGSRASLVDGSGRTLSAAGPRDLGGKRTVISAPVPSSHWRVVLSVPDANLYESVAGSSRAGWELFAAFSAAICALLALGFASARGARRLAAVTEREQAARAIAHERLHDALTGLPNRNLFHDRAEHAIAAARRRDASVGVVFMDIDDLKRINESLGHEAGDAVMREVARRLDATVRAVDTISRFGGDEFVLLCEEVEDSDVLRLVARIQDALRDPVLVDDRHVPVSVSIGVAVHCGGDDARSASDLLRDADAAMSRAKALGRGRVEIFDGELHQQAVARLDAELALRQAIDNDELVLHYQPIVALGDGALHGVEALVRWRRKETGELVPPGDFIPLAEATGLISEIGDWVLRTAVREVGSWARRGLVDDDFELSVNVSAHQLGDPRLAETVAQALSGWDRPAGRLCLEITETAMMLDPATAERTLDNIDALGVRLALDDFGVGHSSLGQLARSLPISVLKLDRSFVAGMASPRDRGIVEAAAALARALDLSSVAEGVESAEQAVELAAMGFPYAQGFHFGRPVPAADLVARLGTAVA